jgi:hypothetical protein
MSCASRRVNCTFMRGCGSSSANASVSGLVANFRAITSNGGASGTSLRWVGDTIWQLTHRVSAMCRPLSASAASAADATKTAATTKEEQSSCTKPSLNDLRAGPGFRKGTDASRDSNSTPADVRKTQSLAIKPPCQADAPGDPYEQCAWSVILRIALAAFWRQRRCDHPVQVPRPAHADGSRVLDLRRHVFPLVADAAQASSDQWDKDGNQRGNLRSVCVSDQASLCRYPKVH